jgi:pimeloyl-ACP methyl ester carboxylesterase
MYRYVIILWLSGLLFSTWSYAGTTVVLVHGYLADGSNWRFSGIVAALQAAGIADGGNWFPHGPPPISPYQSERYVYTVTLPSEAPLPVQAQWLDFYLRSIQHRHPDNDLILVGHSAGGVVARLVMVSSNLPIQGLITIASPHLGTDKAELGAQLSNSPWSWIAPFFGLDTINRSEGLYWDLVREYPATPLFGLNRQPHPDNAFYVSIIRIGDDEWVPPYSQDMNNVPALRGRSLTITTGGTHSLHPADGPLLVSLLDRLLTHPNSK